MFYYFNNNFMKCKNKAEHLYNYLFLSSIYNILNLIFILGKCISYPFSLTYNVCVKAYRILSQYILLLTKSILKIIKSTILLIIPKVKIAFIIFVAIYFAYEAHVFFSTVPNPKSISDFKLPHSLNIYDKNNILLYSSYAGAFTSPVPLKSISKKLIYEVNKKSSIEISSKLCSHFYFYRENEPIKKQILVFNFLRNFNKQELIYLYLNTKPYGNHAIGIEATSQIYLGKRSLEINEKDIKVLNGNSNTNLKIVHEPYKRAPIAVNYVLKSVKQKYGKNLIREKFDIYTNIDLNVQNKLQQELLDNKENYNNDLISKKIENSLIITKIKDSENNIVFVNNVYLSDIKNKN